MINKQGHWTDGMAIRIFTATITPLYFLLIVPIWGPLLAIHLLNPLSESASVVAKVTFLVCALVAWWHARATALLMVDEDKSFKVASTHIFYSIIGKLSFLPVIGKLFERILNRQHYKNPYLSKEDSDS